MRLILDNIPLKTLIDNFRWMDTDKLVWQAEQERLSVNDAQVLQSTGELLVRKMKELMEHSHRT